MILPSIAQGSTGLAGSALAVTSSQSTHHMINAELTRDGHGDVRRGGRTIATKSPATVTFHELATARWISGRRMREHHHRSYSARSLCCPDVLSALRAKRGASTSRRSVLQTHHDIAVNHARWLAFGPAVLFVNRRGCVDGTMSGSESKKGPAFGHEASDSLGRNVSTGGCRPMPIRRRFNPIGARFAHGARGGVGSAARSRTEKTTRVRGRRTERRVG